MHGLNFQIMFMWLCASCKKVYYLLPPPSSLILWSYYMAQDYTLSFLSPFLSPSLPLSILPQVNGLPEQFC